MTTTIPSESVTTAQLGENWRLQLSGADGIPLDMLSFEVIDFGAISYFEIFQNVKTILATPLFSAALERTLGLDQTIVDRPLGEAAEITVAILDAVTRWEPRCQITDISFDAEPLLGHLICKIKLNIKNVIYGTNTPYPAKNIWEAPARVTQGLPMDQVVIGPKGDQGPQGIPGPTGPRGSLWFVGATDPDSSTSIGGITLQDQDMYLNTTSGDVFTWIEIDTRRGWQKTKAKRK